MWFIPTPGMPAYKDKQVPVKAFHDDIGIFYSLQDDSSAGSDDLKSCDFHLMLLPEKVAAYGDASFRSALSKAAKYGVRTLLYSKS